MHYHDSNQRLEVLKLALSYHASSAVDHNNASSSDDVVATANKFGRFVIDQHDELPFCNYQKPLTQEQFKKLMARADQLKARSASSRGKARRKRPAGK